MEDQREGAAAQPAKVEDFVGYQVWMDPDGRPNVTLFQAGRMIDLVPDDPAAHQTPGFFDLSHNPVPDPV